jgi:hypothetical protein
VERWKAPLLNGPGWFFSVEVPIGFEQNAGRGILTKYRMRIFLPLAIELPIAIAFFLTNHPIGMSSLVMVMTLLTRLAYYANRNSAEKKAGAFRIPGSYRPASAVCLSLEPRSLRDYTNLWMEAAIAASLVGSIASLTCAGIRAGDWHPQRGAWAVILFAIYVQLGLLLMKRSFVRARSAAPAQNAELYMKWRESLRRLSTAICDILRIFLVLPVFAVSVPFLFEGAAAIHRAVLEISILAMLPLGWYEWRTRLAHLKLARSAKPVELLVRPDTTSLDTVVCFRPSLPILLLKGPNGYALNLASAPARTAAAYLAGSALLLAILIR